VEVLVATAAVLALAGVLVFYNVIGVPAAPSAGPSSSVTTVPTTAETSSSGPSATSATSGPQPTSTTGPRPSTSQLPPVTTTTRTSDGPKPPAEDPGRYAGVQEKRVVELVPQTGYNWVDIENWRHDASTPGEVQMDAKGVFTALSAKLAVIVDTPLANRDRCANVTTWRDRVDFSELHVGSQLCGRSREGRYASLEVRVLPSSSDGRFFFYGITWN
jgi:hypothetical protein